MLKKYINVYTFYYYEKKKKLKRRIKTENFYYMTLIRRTCAKCRTIPVKLQCHFFAFTYKVYMYMIDTYTLLNKRPILYSTIFSHNFSGKFKKNKATFFNILVFYTRFSIIIIMFDICATRCFKKEVKRNVYFCSASVQIRYKCL